MWVTERNGLWSYEHDLVSYLEGAVDESSGSSYKTDLVWLNIVKGEWIFLVFFAISPLIL